MKNDIATVQVNIKRVVCVSVCLCAFVPHNLGYEMVRASDLTELKVQRLFWDEGWKDQKSCGGQVKVEEILE